MTLQSIWMNDYFLQDCIVSYVRPVQNQISLVNNNYQGRNIFTTISDYKNCLENGFMFYLMVFVLKEQYATLMESQAPFTILYSVLSIVTSPNFSFSRKSTFKICIRDPHIFAWLEYWLLASVDYVISPAT